MTDIKFLAFYLPQFHPIPENDKWWGKGFTEWTNVKKAKPLFKGHLQPKEPGKLGYYDLREPKVREQQVELAKKYGVSGFIYYHYWFGNGFQVLEGIANSVLKTKTPDFPFCFCWANETWSGRWHGLDNKILAKQTYPGHEDIKSHFNYLLPFFKDKRYIKVDGKPVLVIYKQKELAERGNDYINKLRRLAKSSGFSDLYVVASNVNNDDIEYKPLGYDAKISYEVNRVKYKYLNSFHKKSNSLISKFSRKILRREKVPRLDAVKMFEDIRFKEADVPTYPMVLPNWDNTPRSSYRGEVFENTSPQLFENQILKACKYIEDKNYNQKLIIIKSWNEWAEGNYLEPDRINGYGYLEAIKNAISKN